MKHQSRGPSVLNGRQNQYNDLGVAGRKIPRREPKMAAKKGEKVSKQTTFGRPDITVEVAPSSGGGGTRFDLRRTVNRGRLVHAVGETKLI